MKKPFRSCAAMLRRHARVAAVAALVTTLATLLTPAAASASTYVWRVNADGVWTNPGNWSHVAGSGPLGPGYPTARGDVALFGNEVSNFTAFHTITIPNDVFITVGTIVFNSSFGFAINPGGANCRLELDNGAAPALVARYVTSNDNDFVRVPIRLLSPLVVEYTPPTSVINVAAPIGEAGGAYSVTKRAGGQMFLRPLTGNSYTGRTIVENGLLTLMGEAGPTVLGELVIGNENAADAPARVHILRPDQVADFASVRVGSDGQFTVQSVERIADLTVSGGTVTVTPSGTSAPVASLAMRSLTMTGGVLQSQASGQFVLDGNVTAVSTPSGPAVVRVLDAGNGVLDLGSTTRTFLVNQGPSSHDLELAIPVRGTAGAGLTKDGLGRLRFTGAGSNTYPGVTLVRQGRLELARDSSAIAIPAGLQIGAGMGAVVVELMAGISNRHNIADSATVTVTDGATLILDSDEGVNDLNIGAGGRVVVGQAARAGVYMSTLGIVGGRLTLADEGRLFVHGDLVATSTQGRPAVVDGSGSFGFDGSRNLFVVDGPEAIDLVVDTGITTGTGQGRFTKRSAGVMQVGGRTGYADAFIVSEGALLMVGVAPLSPITVAGGILGGTGSVGEVTASTGRVAPGVGRGRLRSGSIAPSAGTTLAMELNGPTAGSGYDQLAVTGSVSLGSARLEITAAGTLPPIPIVILIDNDGTDQVTGTFAGLAEGAPIRAGGRDFTLSYHGGDGNDVVLTDDAAPVTYFLAEGATGAFFDDDVLIANPNTTDAPVTLTFLLEGGRTVVEHRNVPAQARLTVHVDEIPGLEATAASVEVKSDSRLPLVVERSMFWDEHYYGGHTANAVAQPETRWIFAEGFQGFFDTFILIANANAEATTATLTFLREGAPPVVTTVPVGPFARKTVYAGDYPDLVGRAFGVVVEATRPVIAERAMYFGSQPGRLWAGGHANTGIAAPETSWFHAEGATGGFFSTFILLSNPNDAPAHVQLRFLLSTGEVITRQKTLAARARLTINPAAEGDPRLENAALSTVVQSDLPIVSERSMYWPGEARPFGEGHNSSGVVSLATRWGLAEGRLGGTRSFDTYILLANPGTVAAQVRITYLRESGAPVVKTYTVPPTSRFNIDVKTVVPELQDGAFGARIDVTNDVPIAVERSMYWNAAGVFWAGGTNALGMPLP